MKKKIIGVVLLVTIPLILWSAREHVVKKGDTLWDIAGFYYNNPFAWVAIWKANMEKIKDPHWIYPGQVFVIPELVPEEMAKMPRGVYKVKEKPSVQEIAVVRPPLPGVAPELVLSSGFVDMKENVKPFGIIMRTEPPGIKNLYYYQKVYINKGSLDGLKEGDVFLVYKIGPAVKSKTKGNLGNYFKILGKIRILKLEERSALAEILPSYDLIHVKDYIMPVSMPEIPYDVRLVPSEREITAQIVFRTRPKNEILKPYEIVIIDAGEEEGVKIGDLFEVYRAGEVRKDPMTKENVKLPDLFLGTLQVLNVKGKASTAYLRAVTREDIKIGDYVRLVGELAK